MHQQRGQIDLSRQVLREAREAAPAEPGYWTAAIQSELISGNRDEAARLLEAAAQSLGDVVPLRLSRLTWLTMQPGGPDLNSVQQLATGLDGFDEDERFRLLAQVAVTLRNLRNPQAALSITRRMCELRPDDREAWLPHLEAAAAARQVDEADQALLRIQSIDGPESPAWMLGRAIVDMIRLGANLGATDRQELNKLLTRVTAQRPEWSRPYRYLGRVQELEGHFDEALQSYSRAVELGERDPALLNGYLELLNELEQFGTAETVAQRILLEQENPRQIDEIRFASQLAFNTGRKDKALELAQACVRVEEQNALNHLWLATVLDGRNRADEAEQVLRQATARFSTEGSTWVALTGHLVNHGQSDAVIKVLADAEVALQGKDRPLHLARCHDLAGNFDAARGFYQEALQDNPPLAGLIAEVAGFEHRTGNSDDARTLYQRVLSIQNLPPLAEMQVRRKLAALLSADGYSSLVEALRLLDQNIARRATLQDQLLKAQFLAVSEFPADARAAVQILLDVEKKAPLQERDQLLLARLHDRLKRDDEARKRWRALSETAQDAEVLAACVSKELSLNQMRFAATTLNRLKSVSPESEQIVFLEAILTAQRGNVDDAVSQLSRWAAEAPAADDGRQRVMKVLETLEIAQRNLSGQQPEQAARLVAATRVWLSDLSARDPGLVVPLIALLVRDGDVQGAFDRASAAADAGDRRANRTHFGAEIGPTWLVI